MKFSELVEYFKALEETSSRMEMWEILYRLFKSLTPDEAQKVVYLTLGQILPSFYCLEFGVSEKLIMEALSKSSGIKSKDIEALYKRLGDLGEVAKGIIRREGRSLDVLKVYDELLSIARSKGTLDKVMKLINLLNALSSDEARYAVRIVEGRLRLGVGDTTIVEALSLLAGDKAYKQVVERAYNLCSDLGLVAKELLEKGIKALEEFKIRVGYPIRMALAERVSSAEEIIKRLGRCAVEAKYDGMRIQVHKRGKEVFIYSRNLENVTHMFPEVVEATLKDIKRDIIIFEGESITYDEETGEIYPFQVTIQRKRKYGVLKYAQEYPLKVFAFDILYIDDQDITQKPFIERRRVLEEVINKGRILPSEMRTVESVEEVQKFFDDTVSRGLEGIMAKRLDAPYTAGSRNFNWIKLKRSYRGSLADTVDVVIVGYFYGRGARSKLGIGSLLVAVYDPRSDTFKTISKVGSGFTEDEWKRLKEMLDKIKLFQRHARVDSIIDPDVWVEPKYVITVNADEITRSPLHTAGRSLKEEGYALRFPRAVSFVRFDKKPEDTTTVEEIIRLHELQQKKALD